MHTFMKLGLVSMLVLAAACEKTQPARDPISKNDPQPQEPALGAPAPQKSTIGSGGAQSSTFGTKPQEPTMNAPGPQKAFSEPEVQKPFYGPGLTSPDDRAAAKTERPLSDGEILMVTRVANEGEVQMAELAKKKATRKDVKEFAGLMATHHTAALQKGRTVQSNTKLTPSPTELSTKLDNDASAMMTSLRAKEGKEFDSLYIDTQVRAHKDVLDVVDNRLLTNVNNGEVKTMLTEMRRTVADHLAKAEDIQKKIDPTTAAARKGTKAPDTSKGKTSEPPTPKMEAPKKY